MTLKRYYDYIAFNRDIKYFVFFEPLPSVDAIHKWVGAQNKDDCIYAIPNDMNAVLKHTINGNFYIGDLENDPFKWTGGCLWKGSLYGFPRTSNCLLKMSLDTELIQYVYMEKDYSKEHHYGGICTKEGIIYQPPRDSDHILVWDLKTASTRKIHLSPKSKHREFRYCGSVLCPNGYAYFLPELAERVIKLNTATEEWEFIGDRIDAMTFDAKIAVDGNIYGFSAYCDGILKINVTEDNVEMIHKEITPGAYGTKLGVNGHLYSIPGDGEYIWDYDPLTDSLKSIYKFPYKLNAKYAGGTSLQNGEICAVPARENKLLKLKMGIEGIKIPDKVYGDYFLDYY